MVTAANTATARAAVLMRCSPSLVLNQEPLHAVWRETTVTNQDHAVKADHMSGVNVRANVPRPRTL
jgi:hypothetical protein